MNLSRDAAVLSDRTDPLAEFRTRFAEPVGSQIVYMDGNSLGRQPKEAPLAVARAIDAWRDQQIIAWRDWIKLPQRLGDIMTGSILEARPGEVIFGDSTSIDLYKLAAAALSNRPERKRIVTSDDNFPTDLYVLQSLAESSGAELVVVPADPIEGLATSALAGALDEQTALVSLSHVAYRSGALLDMTEITRRVHVAGALVLWDLSHSAGAVEVPLESAGVDLATGCSYKYLNGGPGAPAYIYVREDLQTRLRQPLWGWFGHREQFRMSARFEPADGIERFLSGAPAILSTVAIEPGLLLLAQAGVPAIRDKGRRLADMIVHLADAWLAPLGFTLASPRDPARRGSHVSLRRRDAKELVKAMIRHGVVPDFRPPDLVRLGPAPLYTRYEDVWLAMDCLRRVASVA